MNFANIALAICLFSPNKLVLTKTTLYYTVSTKSLDYGLLFV